MAILDFLKEYWALITFGIGELAVVWGLIRNIIKSCKCTLRNDILDIYEKCQQQGYITTYQLQCINFSYDVYKKLKGNSFVDTIVKEKIPQFDVEQGA